MKLTLFFATTALLAQQGQTVNQSLGSPPTAVQQLNYFSGTNLIYSCVALSDQPTDQNMGTVSAVSNASPAELTMAAAHGFGDFTNLGATVSPVVVISGGTGAWAAINGTRVATVTSTTKFTVAVDSGAFGAVAGTLVVTTRSPLLASPVWAIQKLFYDGSNNPIAMAWLAKTGALASSTSYDKACSSRASYAAQ